MPPGVTTFLELLTDQPVGALVNVLLLISVVLWWRIPAPRRRLFAILGPLLHASLVLECYGLWSTIDCTNTSPWYNGYQLLEFGLVLWMGWLVLPRGRVWYGLAAVAGVLAFAAGIHSYGGLNFLLVESVLVLATLQAILCVLVLWHLADQGSEPLLRMPAFWLFMGLLVYFGGVVPAVGTARWLNTHDPDTGFALWSLVQWLAIVRFVFTAVACAMERRGALHHGEQR